MDAKTDDKSAGECPFLHTQTNRDWWPNQLDIQVLHRNSKKSDPMGKDFDYAEAFKTLDLDAVIADLRKLMTNFAGMVASRLRPLWTAVHSHGVA